MTIIGNQVQYFIVQINGEEERYIEYSTYNGSFTETDNKNSATAFTAKQTAIDLAKLMNAQASLLKDRTSVDSTYVAVEEITDRKSLNEDGTYTGADIVDGNTTT